MEFTADTREVASPGWFVPALAVAVAVATGLFEIPLALLRRDLFLVPIEGDMHILWMAVLANLVLVIPIAALLWVVNRIWPNRRTEGVAAMVLFTLAAYALLAYLPRSKGWGILILAVGIGVQSSRLAMRHRQTFHLAARRRSGRPQRYRLLDQPNFRLRELARGTTTSPTGSVIVL